MFFTTKRKGWHNMKKTYNINIAGTTFGIVSDEPEQHIRLIEKEITNMVSEVQSHGASSHKAALFVCFELYDKLLKLSDTEKNIEKKYKKPDERDAEIKVSQTTLF